MKWHRFRFGAYLSLVALCILGLVRLYYFLTDDFRISNITHDLAHEPQWDIPALPHEEQARVLQILQQPFHYIGKGAQCYAFVSQDGQYVLKFFKFKHLKPSWLVYLIPPIAPLRHYKESLMAEKKRKIHALFEGYIAAYCYDQDHAKVLYLHLLPTHDLHQSVTLFDKMGRQWHVDLDSIVFLLQKKGETLRTHLDRQLSQHHIEEAMVSLSQIVRMYLSEYQRGLYDRDPGVMHNTGFVDNQPFHLDVGKLTKEDRMCQIQFYKKDLKLIIWKIDTWIQNHFPQYYSILSTHLDKQYQEIIGEPLDLIHVNPLELKKRRLYADSP